MFAFILKTRAQYDGAMKGGDKAKVDKLRESLNKPIVAMGKKMATIDPKGGNSNVTTDYDVMLNALANDYPEAIDASFDGDKQPLADQTAELDKRIEEGRGLARRAQERQEVIAETRSPPRLR